MWWGRIPFRKSLYAHTRAQRPPSSSQVAPCKGQRLSWMRPHPPHQKIIQRPWHRRATFWSVTSGRMKPTVFTNTHIVNSVGFILPEVTDQKVALLCHGLWILFWWGGCGRSWLILWTLHGATCEYEGGRCARVWAQRLCRKGMRPHHIYHCDAMWLGHPYYSWGHRKWRRRRCSRHIIWVGLGDLGYIKGRGHLAIPVHPVLSCLLSTTALSETPPSLSPAGSGVRFEQGHTSGSLPVNPLTDFHSAPAPLLSPPLKMRRGPSYWTHPGPWVLQRDVLRWHRMSPSSQGMSVSGLGGPDPPILLVGRWTPALGLLVLRPGRGLA